MRNANKNNKDLNDIKIKIQTTTSEVKEDLAKKYENL